MKLTKLKKVLLSLLLLNTLVACKYQVDFEQLDSDGNVITNNLELIEQPAEILDHEYNIASGELTLKVSTTSYVGELKSDLDMSHCTQSYPAACYAKLNVYSQRIKSDIDFGLPAIMVSAELTIDLSDLQGVSELRITDDAGKSILVNLKEYVATRRHEAVTIKDVQIDQDRGVFTITAQHQICDGPGELELNPLLYTMIDDPAPVPSTNGDVALMDQPLEVSRPTIHPILPVAHQAKLVYTVKGGQPELDCLLAEGFFFTVSKTFSFEEAGIGPGGTLLVSDATKRIIKITNKKIVTNNLLPIADIKIDVRNSVLLITSSIYVNGKVEMKPCMIADNFDQGISYQSCEAEFVSSSDYNRSSIVALAHKTSKFHLSEVGLGQDNSTLILSSQNGRFIIHIDKFGNGTVQKDFLVELQTAE